MPLEMQSSHSDQMSSLQTHLTAASDPVTFEHAKDMATMSQKRWNKLDKQEVMIAYLMQLNQSHVELHGSRDGRVMLQHAAEADHNSQS